MTAINKEEKKHNNDTMCHRLTMMRYKGAPKLKMCDSTFTESLKAAGLISMADTFIYVVEYMKAAIAQGANSEEILGKMQLDLMDAWDLLAGSKMGCGAFKRMDIKDVLESGHPSELIEKSAFVKVR